MAKRAWVKWWLDDFAGGTAHLSNEEVGVYVRLLCHQAAHGFLPGDDERCRRIARCDKEEWASIWPMLVDKFDTDSDGNRHNPRMSKEVSEADNRRESAQKAALARHADAPAAAYAGGHAAAPATAHADGYASRGASQSQSQSQKTEPETRAKTTTTTTLSSVEVDSDLIEITAKHAKLMRRALACLNPSPDDETIYRAAFAAAVTGQPHFVTDIVRSLKGEVRNPRRYVQKAIDNLCTENGLKTQTVMDAIEWPPKKALATQAP